MANASEVYELVDAAVQEVSASVGRLVEVSRLYPQAVSTDCQILLDASDQLSELLAKIADRKRAA